MNPYLKRCIEILFPAACQLCREDMRSFSEKTVCHQCLSRVHWGFRLYPNLASLSAVVVGGELEGKLRDLIHLFKYRGKQELATELSSHLLRPDFLSLNHIDCLVPVPISIVRKLKRGFNQSEVLAQRLGKKWGKPVMTKWLFRVPFSRSQVNLNRAQRSKNARLSFKPKNKKNNLKGRNVLLIDDVITTGATLQSCAKLLRSMGANQIWGLTLAQESLKR